MKALWHKHRWTISASRQGQYVRAGGDCTTILYVCSSCGAVRSELINGHWTREELDARGKSS